MRASTRRRITIALVGLLVLALIGWFVQDAVAGDAGSGSMPPRTDLPIELLTEIPTDRR